MLKILFLQLTSWTRMFTSCTTGFNIKKNSTLCQRYAFMCSGLISEQTVIISLHNINGLVF